MNYKIEYFLSDRIIGEPVNRKHSTCFSSNHSIIVHEDTFGILNGNYFCTLILPIFCDNTVAKTVGCCATQLARYNSVRFLHGTDRLIYLCMAIYANFPL